MREGGGRERERGADIHKETATDLGRHSPRERYAHTHTQTDIQTEVRLKLGKIEKKTLHDTRQIH